MSLARTSALLFSSSVLYTALAAAVNFVQATALGPAGKGAMAVAILIPGLILVFANPGLHTAVMYLIGKRVYPTAAVFWGLVLFGVALTLGVTAALLFQFDFLRGSLYVGLTEWEVVLSLSAAVPLTLSYIFCSVLLSLGDARGYAQARLVNHALHLVLTVVLIVLLALSVTGGVLAFFLTLVVFTLLTGARLLQQTALTQSLKVSVWQIARATRGLFKFGLISYPGTVGLYLTYRFDLLILSYFAPLSEVGYYSVAVTVAELVLQIPDAMSFALLSHVARGATSDDAGVTASVLRHSVYLNILAAFALWLFSEMAIRLVLPTFVPALAPLRILLPGLVAGAIYQLLLRDLASRGHPTLPSVVAVLTASCGAVLYLWLIPRYGMVGAAWASLLLYTGQTALIVLVFCRITRLRIGQVIRPTPADLMVYRSASTQLITKLRRAG